jgi:hypothetical protein
VRQLYVIARMVADGLEGHCCATLSELNMPLMIAIVLRSVRGTSVAWNGRLDGLFRRLLIAACIMVPGPLVAHAQAAPVVDSSRRATAALVEGGWVTLGAANKATTIDLFVAATLRRRGLSATVRYADYDAEQTPYTESDVSVLIGRTMSTSGPVSVHVTAAAGLGALMRVTSSGECVALFGCEGYSTTTNVGLAGGIDANMRIGRTGGIALGTSIYGVKTSAVARRGALISLSFGQW